MTVNAALFWLVLTCLMTALMWIPGVINRFMVRGVGRTLGNPSPKDTPHEEWAERSLAAHRNAIEGLAIFAPLVLIAQFVAPGFPTVSMSASIYFWARLVHYVVYTLGVPVLRTLAFAISWLATVAVAGGLLGKFLVTAG